MNFNNLQEVLVTTYSLGTKCLGQFIMKRKITKLIIILFFYIMPVSAARVISIANISPNWLIIVPVFFCGKNDGMFAGFFLNYV